MSRVASLEFKLIYLLWSSFCRLVGILVSSVRSSSGDHGVIEIQQQQQGHFSKLFQILQIRK